MPRSDVKKVQVPPTVEQQKREQPDSDNEDDSPPSFALKKQRSEADIFESVQKPSAGRSLGAIGRLASMPDLGEARRPLPSKGRSDQFELQEDGDLSAAHCIWPATLDDQDEFVASLVSELMHTGYCLIEMPELDGDEVQSLLSQVQDMQGWHLLPQEFEAAYLGQKNVTKLMTLQDDIPGLVGDDIVTLLDRQLSNLNLLLYSDTQSFMDFQIWGRLNTYLRTPMSFDEELNMKKAVSEEFDWNDGRVFGHLNFLERRKLSFFYLAYGGPCQVKLLPAGMPINNDLVMSAGQLLVFRHDLMTYQYRAGADDIVLQAWVVSEPWVEELGDTCAEIPVHMQQDNRTNVLAAHAITAGAVHGMDKYWAAFFGGNDGFTAVPSARWDHSEYYEPDQAGDHQGMAYAMHGAFVDTDQLSGFDCEFFNMHPSEVESVSPAQRIAMEVGYETLQMAGFYKETVRGQNIATMTGDSQSDWINLASHMAPTPTSYAGSQNSITGSRLSFALGLRGPSQHIDTACSSSLVALDRGHQCITQHTAYQCRPNTGGKCKMALITGLSVILDPHLFVGYCGAKMLSPTGRCFTFNESANGFARGEGCSSVFLNVSSFDDGHPDMLCVLVGSFTNQDGRSATMTAPNGPSQREATKASLKMSGFDSSEVSACECHGTGTALGDPIEVSALRGAFAQKPGDHPDPLPHTSAKTNVGHNEANAGLLGLTKCIMMIMACTTPPNNHLGNLNHHLDVNGYPALFGSAAYPFGTATVNTGLMGVSSFGSGGTNARADIWGRCMRGHAKTTGFIDYDDIMRKRGAYFERVEENGHPGPQPSDELFLIGTWNAWKNWRAMELNTETGIYEGLVTIGETQCEQFHIILNKDRDAAIHPLVPMAKHDCTVVGPDMDHKGKHWVIDASDKATVGATFKIKLQWTFDWERGESKNISWEEVKVAPQLQDLNFQHRYFMVGTWTTWKLFEMAFQGSNVYKHETRLGGTGMEEFQIVRDKDWAQVIHPAVPNCIKTSVPIKGPDSQGSGKHWTIRGPPGARVEIKLKINSGFMELEQKVENKGTKKWLSTDTNDWHEYFMAGSWNQYKLHRMTQDQGGSFLFRYEMKIGKEEYEDFRIVLDKDPTQCLHAGPDGYTCVGPDDNFVGNEWRIQGPEGLGFEIILSTQPGNVWVEWRPN